MVISIRALCLAIVGLVALPAAGCSKSEHPPALTSSVALAPTPRAVHEGRGIACSYNGTRGAPSYAVGELGLNGVPALSASERKMLRAIMKYVHPSTLRFTFLSGIVHFVVFDAREGACSSAPYSVLSSPWCNSVFVPADINTGALSAAGGCFAHPRPWIPHDGGNTKAPTWERYDNSH